MHLLGIINEPLAYEVAADLYLEGFPQGSYTALLETAARGVYPVLQYAPPPQVDFSGDRGLQGLVVCSKDETEYIEQVTALINDPAERGALGQAVGQQITATHYGARWQDYLRALYEYLAQTAHAPAPLPALERVETEADLNLSAFNQTYIKTALLQQLPANLLAGLTLVDLFRLCCRSLRVGDTRLTPAHLRVWLGLLKNKVWAKRKAGASPVPARSARDKQAAALARLTAPEAEHRHASIMSAHEIE
jgi:hypothetical protein